METHLSMQYLSSITPPTCDTHSIRETTQQHTRLGTGRQPLYFLSGRSPSSLSSHPHPCLPSTPLAVICYFIVLVPDCDSVKLLWAFGVTNRIIIHLEYLQNNNEDSHDTKKRPPNAPPTNPHLKPFQAQRHSGGACLGP